MPADYYKTALDQATDFEKELLLDFLTKSETEIIRKSVDKNALLVEFPNWKIAFYSEEDMQKVVDLLQANTVMA